MIRARKVWALAAAGLLTASLAVAQPRRPGERAGGRWKASLTDKMAPDFELPLIEEAKDAKAQKTHRLSKEKVKLSSFRGRNVVCVFFSSYT